MKGRKAQSPGQNAEPKVSFAERVAQRLIEQLEAGTAPWQRPWDPDAPTTGVPMNPTSGKRYHGINVPWLMAQGYEDPRFCTYKQAAAAGWQVRRGEKGTTIEFWTKEKEERGPDGVKRIVKLDRAVSFYSSVFNVGAQIDGAPAYQPPVRTWDPIERADALVQASEAWIDHRQGNAAFYSPASDRIIVPLREQFPSADRYYATVLHELGHWSGHGSRLARDLTGTFASESYAKEELRAEIASLMIGSELGVGHDPGQHAAYVKSWVRALKDDPREIFRASADAEKIHAYLMAFDRHREQEHAPERPATPAPAPVPVEPVAARAPRRPARVREGAAQERGMAR
jgi:antirestriction protein ArdC